MVTTDETTSLLRSPTGRKRQTETTIARDAKRNGILVNRVLILMGLMSVLVVSLYFQHGISNLSSLLLDEQWKLQEMNETIKIHEEVIERFNASVTNSDVLQKIGNLESDLASTRQKVTNDLNVIQSKIAAQLNETLVSLSKTVDDAETEISDQVERVKKDVEQYVLTTQDQFSLENSFMVYQLAGTFTLLSCLISMWHMTAHLRKMNQPDVQRRILAILWMSPIYAITSWFSLVFHSAEGYLAIIKDGYESYIIYQFLSFCIAVLGKGDRNAVVDLLARRADHMTPPFRLFGVFEICCSCCRPDPYVNDRALADAILLQCQFFALQFVFFRPLTTTAMVVLDKLQYYGLGTGPTDYRSPQFYIVIVQNVSIFVAFAGLLKFYHAVDQDLAWCRPFAKFLCIKGVVFMTFWQGLALGILAQTTDVGGQDADEWGKSAQNFLICLEMLLFSIAHFYCFPTEEWEEGYRVKHSQGRFGDSIALGDFFEDVKLILKSNPTTKAKLKKSNALTIPEQEELEVNRDEVEESQTTATDAMCETDKTDRAIASALERSLGAAGDDPDIAEAKRRLLESGILSPEFFEGSESYDEGSSDMFWSEDERSENEGEGSVDSGDPSDERHGMDKEPPNENAISRVGGSGLKITTPTENEILSNLDGTGGIERDCASRAKKHIEPEIGLTSDATTGGYSVSSSASNRLELPAPSSNWLPSVKTGVSANEEKGSTFAEMLRPSIFTTVASIAASSTPVDNSDSPPTNYDA